MQKVYSKVTCGPAIRPLPSALSIHSVIFLAVLEHEFGVEYAKDYTVRPAMLERIMKFAVATAFDEVSARDHFDIR